MVNRLYQRVRGAAQVRGDFFKTQTVFNMILSSNSSELEDRNVHPKSECSRQHTFQQRSLIWPVHPTARPRHLVSPPVFEHKEQKA